MGLLDLKTDLKSLKFGKDRPGGGDSGQPYIKNTIGVALNDKNIIPQNEDFLLRGGMNAPLDAATDIVRLGKMFGDLKSPNGVLFIAKQNILAATSVKTQASRNTQQNGGIYTPLNTLAQAGVGFLGGHINKQGIPGGEIILYSDVVNKFQSPEENRLVALQDYVSRGASISNWNNTGLNLNLLGNLMSYYGGPGSILGVGDTNIKFSNNKIGQNLTPEQATNINNNLSIFSGNTLAWTQNQITSINNVDANIEAPLGYDSFMFNSKFIHINSQIRDFRLPLIEPLISQDKSLTKRTQDSRVTSISPSYNPRDNKTLDNSEGTSRVNYRSPGAPGNVISYTNGKTKWNGTAWESMGAVDKINAAPIYTSEEDINPTELKVNDLINFRISALNGQNSNSKDHIFFRAYIDNFSDKYSAKWKSIDYTGRGESFYKYGGFDRSISLGFTVAAQSREELLIQYEKLNYLASNLAPEYSPQGYMGGPLVQLTMGGWCYELPGFISSLSLSIPKESPWEIGINDNGDPDESISQLPHIVQVNGFSFTPIHTFRPSKQINPSNGSYDKKGNEKYISIANSSGIPLTSNPKINKI